MSEDIVFSVRVDFFPVGWSQSAIPRGYEIIHSLETHVLF